MDFKEYTKEEELNEGRIILTPEMKSVIMDALSHYMTMKGMKYDKKSIKDVIDKVESAV